MEKKKKLFHLKNLTDGLASELYDESDYIRDYDEFLEYVKNCGEIAVEEKE